MEILGTMKMWRAVAASLMGLTVCTVHAALDVSTLPREMQLPVKVTYATVTADEGALMRIKSDPDVRSTRPAYGLLADAVIDRMHFRFDKAARSAYACMNLAHKTEDVYAEMQCGMLRLSLSRLQMKLAAMASQAVDVQAAENSVYAKQHQSRDEVNKDPNDSYGWTIDHYSGLKGLAPAFVERKGRGPSEVSLFYRKNPGEGFDDIPHANIYVNGKPVDFVIDTGSYFSMIPKEMASSLGLRSTSFKEPTTDMSGITRTSNTAIADSVQVGGVIVRNFPVLLESDERTTLNQANRTLQPMLGSDFLIFLKRYSISKHRLVLFPDIDGKCVRPALLSGEMDPTIATVLLSVDTNYGNLRLLFDTGDNDYATGSFANKDIYKLNEMPASSRSVATIGLYGAVVNVEADLPLIVNVDNRSIVRKVTIQKNIELPSQMQLGSKTLNDFNYYYDLDRGVACLR
jgi:hypothetical protein